MRTVQNLQKLRVRVRKCYRTQRSSGYCGTGVHSLPKFRVRVLTSYRTYRSSGYGYECPTELAEVLCKVIPGGKCPGYGSVRTLQNTTLEYIFYEEYRAIKHANNSLVNTLRLIWCSSVTSETENKELLDYY